MHSQIKPVSLIITNATIYTMDDMNTVARAMAVDGNRIVAVGSNREIRRSYASDNLLDAKDQYIFPGFIDAHAHLSGLGEEKIKLDFLGTTSPQQITEMVKRKTSQIPKGIWIQGRKWDQNNWAHHEFPTHEMLDAVAPDHPVFLVRIDGHAGWANKRAMQLCGITSLTSDTAGGKIVRDKDGNPTGIFLDNAMELIRSKIPSLSKSELEHVYEIAVNDCLKVGLTEVHDMGLDAPKIDAIKSLISKNKFPFRVYGYIDGIISRWNELLRTGKKTFGDAQLILGGLKLYADGALGSRGALLREPYTDDPTNKGIQINTQEEITRETIRALDKNLQVCVHAIGDQANHVVLNAYEEALKDITNTDHRLRIEHVQVLLPDDVNRFARLHVLPSMQPTHCTSDMYWAEARLGSKRITSAYAWRSLRNTGSIIPGGSDFPVERPNPLLGIYAAVTRQDIKGYPSSQTDIDSRFQLAADSKPDESRYKNGWYGDQRLTREEAIRAFTSWAAYASFQEKEKGTLEPGKLADFVLVDKDITTILDHEILQAKVKATYINGVRVYAASDK